MYRSYFSGEYEVSKTSLWNYFTELSKTFFRKVLKNVDRNRANDFFIKMSCSCHYSYLSNKRSPYVYLFWPFLYKATFLLERLRLLKFSLFFQGLLFLYLDLYPLFELCFFSENTMFIICIMKDFLTENMKIYLESEKSIWIHRVNQFLIKGGYVYWRGYAY